MDLIATAVAQSAAAPLAVWERLSDGLRWREWSLATDWMVAEGGLAPGSIVTIKRKRGRQTAFRVEAAEPGQRLALLMTFGSAARLRLAWTLEPVDGGTRITQTIESGGRLRRWLTDPLARRGAAAWREDPQRLAELASRVGTSVR